MDISMEGTPPVAPRRPAGRTDKRSKPGGERPLPPGIEAHPVMFDGLGSTYFRVWIVNLLLTVVTFGLYVPFARRRTAQYFYGHTVVAGNPLEFTARSRRMFVGYVLMGLLVLAYNIAAETGQAVAVALFVFGAVALAPWLWASATRFRLANTRWRGIRLQFRGPWSEVYRASWPVFLTAGAWLLVFAAGMALYQDWRVRTAVAGAPSTGAWPAVDIELPLWTWALAATAIIVTLLCLIRLEFNYKRLLFTQGQVGDQAGHWKARYGDFVRVWLATAGFLLACLVPFAALAVFAWVQVFPTLFQGVGVLGFVLAPLLAIATLALTWMVGLLPARAFREARMFRLVWNNVGVSDMARFRCDLSTRGYVLLRLRNLLFTFLTLGLYRPFAMLGEYRMKAESVHLLVKGGLDRLAGRVAAQQGALGDAVADAAGLDLIG